MKEYVNVNKEADEMKKILYFTWVWTPEGKNTAK